MADRVPIDEVVMARFRERKLRFVHRGGREIEREIAFAASPQNGRVQRHIIESLRSGGVL